MILKGMAREWTVKKGQAKCAGSTGVLVFVGFIYLLGAELMHRMALECGMWKIRPLKIQNTKKTTRLSEICSLSFVIRECGELQTLYNYILLDLEFIH